MDGTIYDDRSAPLFAFDGATDPAREPHVQPVAHERVAPGDIAVIANPRSHRNKRQELIVPEGVTVAAPRTRPDLRRTLAEFRRDGVKLIVVAGGDGTVRDVLTCGADLWKGDEPAFAVMPCGKTNALAIDLGVPDSWTIADLVAAWRAGRTTVRSPIEIVRQGEDQPVSGFLFGAGTFVDGTEMAQTTHRFGAVNNLAVGLSIVAAFFSTIMGKDSSPWRRGKRIGIRFPTDADVRQGTALVSEGNRFVMLATTMNRLPMSGRALSGAGKGIKTLVVDAPPVRLLRNFIKVLRDVDSKALERDGIHRIDARELSVDLDGGFVLDGERFPAGQYVLTEGAPVTFVSG